MSDDNVVNIGRGKMSPEGLAREIPWKDLKDVFVIAQLPDGRIMLGSTIVEPGVAAFFKLIAEETLTEQAFIAHARSVMANAKPCDDPNCPGCQAEKARAKKDTVAPTIPFPNAFDDDDWDKE